MTAKAELTCAKSVTSCASCKLTHACIIYQVSYEFGIGFDAIKRLTDIEKIDSL